MLAFDLGLCTHYTEHTQTKIKLGLQFLVWATGLPAALNLIKIHWILSN